MQQVFLTSLKQTILSFHFQPFKLFPSLCLVIDLLQGAVKYFKTPEEPTDWQREQNPTTVGVQVVWEPLDVN